MYFPGLRASLNRFKGVRFAGVERIFGELLINAAAARVANAVAGNHDGADREASTRVNPAFADSINRFLEDNPAADGVPKLKATPAAAAAAAAVATPPSASPNAEGPAIPATPGAADDSPSYRPYAVQDEALLKTAVAEVHFQLRQHF